MNIKTVKTGSVLVSPQFQILTHIGSNGLIQDYSNLEVIESAFQLNAFILQLVPTVFSLIQVGVK